MDDNDMKKEWRKLRGHFAEWYGTCVEDNQDIDIIARLAIAHYGQQIVYLLDSLEDNRGWTEVAEDG